MSSEGMSADTVNLPGWHSIRPWTPPLTLTVREITSVSVTFILSATFNDLHIDGDSSLASLGINEEDSTGDDDDEDSSDSPEPKKRFGVSGALADGLSVDVDAAVWRKVFIRIHDKADEAVIIIYGLMPGRQYDIELGLVQGGQKNNIRRQVVTEDVENSIVDDPTQDIDQNLFEHLNTGEQRPSSSPSPRPSTPPNNIQHPTASFAPLTLEDRLNQLQHTLSLITAERDNLTASLKSTRREAQKSDAALKSEIDILRRASEKHNASEHRAKQKVLALQEAVKRAALAAEEMEKQVTEVNEVLPGVKVQKKEKENEYERVKKNADRMRKDKDEETEKERKRVETMSSELAGLTNKLDRLNAKKERFEANTIPDLENKLKAMEEEMYKINGDTYYSEPQDGHVDDIEFMVQDANNDISSHSLPFQRGRMQTLPTNWSSQTLIQWPNANPVWPNTRHNQRSSSMQYTNSQPPTLLQNPHRQSSLKTPLTTSTSSTGSTLSSRAVPFEPGRPLRVLTGQYSAASVPNVRGGRQHNGSAWPSS